MSREETTLASDVRSSEANHIGANELISKQFDHNSEFIQDKFESNNAKSESSSVNIKHTKTNTFKETGLKDSSQLLTILFTSHFTKRKFEELRRDKYVHGKQDRIINETKQLERII